MPPRQCKSKIIEPTAKSRVSDSEIMRILTLAHTGVSTQIIANQVSRSPSTVGRIKHTYNYETFTSRSLTSISKWKTTIHQDRILLRAAKSNDDQAFRDIITISGIKVSNSTLRSQLKEVGLFSHICRHKPFLKSRHKAAQLQWARNHAY